MRSAVRPQSPFETSEFSSHAGQARSLRDASLPSAPISYMVKFADHTEKRVGSGEPAFVVCAAGPEQFEKLLAADGYSAAMAFTRGEFSLEGDLAAAIRFYRAHSHSRFRELLVNLALHLGPAQWEVWFQSRERAARNVRYHYDQPAEFYQQFLDSRLVYSCAYFKAPGMSLDQAQLEKLDLVCRKLDLQSGETFLDVGCGWGALVRHAAEKYGATATGCTLSHQQFEYASRRREVPGRGGSLDILLRDYRDLEGPYDKIASVGMFEHVGRKRLAVYFEKLFGLVSSGGRVLNHGIIRPESFHDDAETVFLRRKVFPGADVPYLREVIQAAERAGFELLDVENLRPHYALTCRAWVRNLQSHSAECRRLTGESVYRSWLVALAASEVNFAEGMLNLCQVLLQKPGAQGQRPMTREYMYAR
jgi:cyclopropane-fatty-acyl-phospholipid synthase